LPRDAGSIIWMLKVAIVLGDERETHHRYTDPQPSFGPAPATLVEGLSRTGEIELHLISCLRQRVSSPAQLGPNVFYHSLIVPPWAFLKTFYVPTVIRVRHLLRQLRPQVVHGQGTERYYALAAAFGGFPSVITVHGNMRSVARTLNARPFSFHWWTARLEGLALRRADGVICLSNFARREVGTLGNQTWMLPNAVPDEFFGIQRHPRNGGRLLCVGTICSYKNQNALIEALEPLDGASRFHLAFAGPIPPGPYGEKFRQLIARNSNCAYLGPLSPEALRQELSFASCLIHPSLEDNCPLAIIEAMAAGLPVIASSCGGIPDLVSSGTTGLICDPSDMSSFRTAVEFLENNPAAATAMGVEAKRRAERDFRAIKIAQQHLAIYRTLSTPE
jgi:glycosyltransferase involved in cell wall biosynthesis